MQLCMVGVALRADHKFLAMYRSRGFIWKQPLYLQKVGIRFATICPLQTSPVEFHWICYCSSVVLSYFHLTVRTWRVKSIVNTTALMDRQSHLLDRLWSYQASLKAKRGAVWCTIAPATMRTIGKAWSQVVEQREPTW